MTVTEVVISREVSSLPIARERLGNSGMIRRIMADTLDQAARVGEQSAETYAPESTRRLKDKISSIPASTTPTGAVEAAVGVGRVTTVRGGGLGPLREGQDLYPGYVHEGTGLYGIYRSFIRPRRARAMRWFGQTGWIHAKATRGQRPQPFIREAFDDLNEMMPALLDRMVDRIFDDSV